MKLINVNQLDDNRYEIEFNSSVRTNKYFSDYTALLGRIKSSYDASSNKWIIDQNGLQEFEKLDALLFPKKVASIAAKPIKSKINKSVENALSVSHTITNYSSMGSMMKLQPYDYQKEIIKFIIDNKNALIVAPCGSGKTPVVIGAFLEARKANLISGRGLVVVKASLKLQWPNEITKFSSLTSCIIETEAEAIKKYANRIKTRERKLEKLTDAKEIKMLKKEIRELKKQAKDAFIAQFKDVDIYVLNYETLRDLKVRKELHKRNIEFVAADEVHYVKNVSSKRAKVLAEFNTAPIKIGATATPVQRDPRDIYGLFKFIKPELFPRKTDFDALYVLYNRWGAPVGVKNARNLNQKIAPNMIVKTHEEVAKELPDINVVQRYTELTPEQAKMHNKIMDQLQELHQQQNDITIAVSPSELINNSEYQRLNAMIMTLQTFAQELADSELLLSESDSDMAKTYTTRSKVNNKLDMLVDIVSEIIDSGEKVCIFSRFARMQKIITDRFNKETSLKKEKIAYIRGDISSEQRFIEAYTKFRDGDYSILLCSDAGAEGLNLDCKYLIEYDLAQSYALQVQRHGRIHRASSAHDTVYVYQLIAEKSYDEIAQKIVQKKEGYDSKIIKGRNYEDGE